MKMRLIIFSLNTLPFLNEKVNNILEIIKSYGKIYENNFKFKKCPINIKETRKYQISGENENIFTKTGSNDWMGTICKMN